MEDKTKVREPPNFKFWGIIMILFGIFFSLVFFNLIPSPEISSEYGSIPVLFVALFFLMFGIISFFNERLRKINEAYRRVLFLVLLILLLVPFHIILFKDKDINYQYFLLAFIIGIFDILGIVLLVTIMQRLFGGKVRNVVSRR
jgi:hypothetical protein